MQAVLSFLSVLSFLGISNKYFVLFLFVMLGKSEKPQGQILIDIVYKC